MMQRGKTIRTARARAAFLAHFAEHGNVTAAAKAAGMSRNAAYCWRNDDPDFAADWDDAEQQAVDKLEQVARERAIDSSDRMMEILLKAHRPEKYVERLRSETTSHVTVTIAGPAADL